MGKEVVMVAAAEAGHEFADRVRYFWTSPEVSRLRALCEQRATKEAVLEALPNRSEPAICQKAGELGFKTPWVRERRSANEEVDEEIRRRMANGGAANDVKAISEKFALPQWYVSRRAGRLGLGKPRLKEPDWSGRELDMVDEWGEKGGAEVHRRLKMAGYSRTIGSVCMIMKRRQVERLGMPSMSARAVAELMGVDPKTVVRWVEERGLKGRRVDGTWSITRKELRRWLFGNPDVFDLKKVRQAWFMSLMTDG